MKLLISFLILFLLVGSVTAYYFYDTSEMENTGEVEDSSGVVEQVIHSRGGEVIFVDNNINGSFERFING